jgi:hypothetical protein
MNRSRILTLVGLKATIAQQAVRREAQKLAAELSRLDALLSQIGNLEQNYKDHLKLPSLRPTEYRDTVSILSRLQNRRSLDTSRIEMLLIERDRLSAILAEKKRHIDRLADEAKSALRQEREERDRIQEALLPARRR